MDRLINMHKKSNKLMTEREREKGKKRESEREKKRGPWESTDNVMLTNKWFVTKSLKRYRERNVDHYYSRTSKYVTGTLPRCDPRSAIIQSGSNPGVLNTIISWNIEQEAKLLQLSSLTGISGKTPSTGLPPPSSNHRAVFTDRYIR